MASGSKPLLHDAKQQLLLLLDEDPAKIPSILKFLQDKPPHAEIQDLVPLDELAIRVELITSIVKKMQKHFKTALNDINDFSFASLLVMPLHALRRLDQDILKHFYLGDLLDANEATYRPPYLSTVKGVLDIFFAKNMDRRGSTKSGSVTKSDSVTKSSSAKRATAQTGSDSPSKRTRVDVVKGKGLDTGENQRPEAPSKVVKGLSKSNEAEKGKRRRHDGYACKVLNTANPEVCHIIPWSSGKDTTVIETFRHGLSKMMLLLELVTNDDNNNNNNNPEADPLRVLGEIQGLAELFCSEPGCSDMAWNMVCLNRQLHDWWGRAQIGFRPLGIVDGDNTEEKKVQVQLYWMPTNLRSSRTAVPYEAKVLPRDVDKLKDRLNEVRTRPQAAAETGGWYAVCRTALGDPSWPGHPVMTGDIFEWSVKTADAGKMKKAFELQWALIRIAAIAGGAGPATWDEEDDEDHGSAVEAWIASLPGPERMVDSSIPVITPILSPRTPILSPRSPRPSSVLSQVLRPQPAAREDLPSTAAEKAPSSPTKSAVQRRGENKPPK
ncbi:hypothetical protein B0T18DRAFT_397135 [Schizothecium vesticola]|uniref:HNH nuclease domain-containing protein n=1 Tax=Schizothecium vesticola TaxID=314040 RepID=A0AA40F9J5_9PEZI|nr:hypothetical protein B0T18DRAFT_397135 [Schizothecium vesticola]